jgi:hypothetical protein
MSEGTQLRDAGIQLVLAHNADWETYCLGKLRRYSNYFAGCEFTPQHFRIWYEHYKGFSPQHFNAWGAMWNHAIKQGIIIKTGRTVNALMPQSHATQLPIYIGKQYAEQKP